MLAVLWCATGPIAALTSLCVGRFPLGGLLSDFSLITYGAVEVGCAMLLTQSSSIESGTTNAASGAIFVQASVAASWLYSRSTGRGARQNRDEL